MKPLNGLSKEQAKAWLAEVSKPLTSSERVAKLRADRDALGLKRLEVYAHPYYPSAAVRLQDSAVKLAVIKRRAARGALAYVYDGPCAACQHHVQKSILIVLVKIRAFSGC